MNSKTVFLKSTPSPRQQASLSVTSQKYWLHCYRTTMLGHIVVWMRKIIEESCLEKLEGGEGKKTVFTYVPSWIMICMSFLRRVIFGITKISLKWFLFLPIPLTFGRKKTTPSIRHTLRVQFDFHKFISIYKFQHN